MALDQLWSRLLRPLVFDARVHAVLHDCARGSPPMLSKWVEAESLEATLEGAMRGWVRHGGAVRIDAAARTVHISSVFSTHRASFEASGLATGPDALSPISAGGGKQVDVGAVTGGVAARVFVVRMMSDEQLEALATVADAGKGRVRWAVEKFDWALPHEAMTT